MSKVSLSFNENQKKVGMWRIKHPASVVVRFDSIRFRSAFRPQLVKHSSKTDKRQAPYFPSSLSLFWNPLFEEKSSKISQVSRFKIIRFSLKEKMFLFLIFCYTIIPLKRLIHYRVGDKTKVPFHLELIPEIFLLPPRCRKGRRVSI